jgi:hypothetical protein
VKEEMSGAGLHEDVLLLDMEAEERKVIAEFCHLLEKSKQLFNGLRDMPQVLRSEPPSSNMTDWHKI